MTFINPYNFVSLGEKRSDAEALSSEDKLLTGYLECELKTLTPLLIPNTSNEYVFADPSTKHKSYEFFSYEDLSEKQFREKGYPPETPIIPGSSLRGALRSVYEALTNSCMSTLTDVPLHSRVPNSRKPGLLFCENTDGKETWFLRPARRYCLETRYHFKDAKERPETWYKHKETGKGNPWQISLPGKAGCHKLKTGSVLRFDVEKERRYGEGSTQGVVLLGEYFDKKKGDHLFVAKAEEAPIRMKQEDIERLKEVLKSYRDTKINKHTTKHPVPHNQYIGYDLKIARTDSGLPVFYDEISSNLETRYYLSPANMSRSVYYNQLSKMARTYKPCSNPKNLCPACALFGMVGDQGALGSRVRVGDARGKKESLAFSPVTLATLLTPKLSSMEFYTVTKKGDYRTYDYETTYSYKDGKPVPNHRIYTPEQLPKLRGRKMYWHAKNSMQGNNIPTGELNVSIRPVKPGSVFSFRMYFDRISDTDLKRLISLLMLAPQLAYKLGRGKPLGFGSVRIEVCRAFIRSLQIKEGIVTHSLKPYFLEAWGKCAQGEQGDVEKEVTILREKAMSEAFESFAKENNEGYQNTIALLRNHLNSKMSVQYPGFKFFAENRGSVMAPKYKYILPSPTAPDLSLPMFPNRQQNNPQGRNQQGNRNQNPNRGGGRRGKQPFR